MQGRRRRLIERSRAAREGRRMHAFYCGFRDARANKHLNPYAQGSEQARCWEAGRQYAACQERQELPSPVCRLGPGGDYVRDWPEANT